jgi:hypothetical protein
VEKIQEVPIEAHNSIGKVERYHAPLRRAYNVMRAEDPSLSREGSLQATVKAVNDTAGPNGLVAKALGCEDTSSSMQAAFTHSASIHPGEKFPYNIVQYSASLIQEDTPIPPE